MFNHKYIFLSFCLKMISKDNIIRTEFTLFYYNKKVKTKKYKYTELNYIFIILLMNYYFKLIFY